MTDYSIIATAQRDIVLEYGNVKIPIKELSYTKKMNVDQAGYYGPIEHHLDITTYPVDGPAMRTVLDNVTKAKLTVNSCSVNMVQEPIMVFSCMIPAQYLRFNTDTIDNNKAVFQFDLEAGNRSPR